MNHVFDLNINPYTGTAEVLLNGQKLSSQSQLRICAIDPISKWYRDLPDLLYYELNDEYTLKLQCVQIEYIMLVAVFSGRTECRNIVYTAVTSKYSTKMRCQWLQEVSNNLGIKIPEIPKFSIITTTDATGYKSEILHNLDPFTRSKCADNEQVTGILTTSNTYLEGKRYVTSDKDIIFVVNETASGMAVEMESCLAVCANKTTIVSLLQQWIDSSLLYPYMMLCHSILSGSGKATTFYTKARLKMLTQKDPVVESKMPAQLECGHSCTIMLEEFPSSRLNVRSSDSSVISVQNGMIKALKTGVAQLEILSESGHVVCIQTIRVYFVPRVTSIFLSVATGNMVLEGEQFIVNAKYTPSNAANIANSKWTVTPSNCLRSIGAGRFEALKAGACTITLQIDGTRQSITVQVIPLPKRIKMTSEIRMKLNAPPVVFHATLEPSGSGCKRIDVRTLDSSVARWDLASKSVVSVNEGSTQLEVSVIDARRNTVLQQRCPITILPEKDIITPPTFPTLVIVCIILAVLTATTVMSPIAALCGGVIAGIELALNLALVLKRKGTRQNKIECGIAVAGIVSCILIIIWYIGLI